MMFCVYFSAECSATGVFVGGPVLRVVCLECVCVLGVWRLVCSVLCSWSGMLRGL